MRHDRTVRDAYEAKITYLKDCQVKLKRENKELRANIKLLKDSSTKCPPKCPPAEKPSMDPEEREKLDVAFKFSDIHELSPHQNARNIIRHLETLSQNQRVKLLRPLFEIAKQVSCLPSKMKREIYSVALGEKYYGSCSAIAAAICMRRQNVYHQPEKSLTYRKWLSLTLAAAIDEFLRRDCNSHQMPDKKYNPCDGRPIVFLVDTMYNLWLKFLNQTWMNVSLSTFCAHRDAKSIYLSRYLKRRVCLCIYHENMSLLIAAIPDLTKSTKELVKMSDQDIYGKIDQMDMETLYSVCQWKKDNVTNRLDIFEDFIKPADIKKLMDDQLSKFRAHVIRMENQNDQTKFCLDNFGPNGMYLHMDFAENWKTKYMDEIHSKYYHDVLVTIKSAMLYLHMYPEDIGLITDLEDIDVTVLSEDEEVPLVELSQTETESEVPSNNNAEKSDGDTENSEDEIDSPSSELDSSASVDNVQNRRKKGGQTADNSRNKDLKEKKNASQQRKKRYYRKTKYGTVVVAKAIAGITHVLSHRFPTTYGFISKIVEYARSWNSNINELYIKTDSPLSQYRNKFSLTMILLGKQLFGLDIVWDFLETGHGKGPCDGVGGAVKSRADRLVKLTGSIKTAHELYDKMRETNTNIKVIYLSQEEYKEACDIVDQWKDLEYFGSSKAHQVWSRHGRLYMSEMSHYCDKCWSEGQKKNCRCPRFWRGDDKYMSIVKTALPAVTSSEDFDSSNQIEPPEDEPLSVQEEMPESDSELTFTLGNAPNSKNGPFSEETLSEKWMESEPTPDELRQFNRSAAAVGRPNSLVRQTSRKTCTSSRKPSPRSSPVVSPVGNSSLPPPDGTPRTLRKRSSKKAVSNRAGDSEKAVEVDDDEDTLSESEIQHIVRRKRQRRK